MDNPKDITKRDGRTVPFDSERIRVCIRKAMIEKNAYNREVLDKVMGDALGRIEDVFRDRTPTVEEIQDIVEVSLMRNGLFEVAKAYIIYRSKKTELREEKKKVLNKKELDEVDKRFSLNALRLLAARYLIKDEKGLPTETPKQMFQRIAVTMAIPEVLFDPRAYSKEEAYEIKAEDADIEVSEYIHSLDEHGSKYSLNGWPINKWHFERMATMYRELAHEGKMRKRFSEILQMLESREFRNAEHVAQDAYGLMVSRDFLPNTPTIVNSGRKLGMLSACFTLDVEDNMESIMKLAHDCAMVHKSGGGTGMNFSKLRPEGGMVASTTGVASGPISFMKMIDAVSDVIKQGGVRRAANMGILEAWHPDVEKFITAKQKEGILENFNISVGMGADFWEHLAKGDEYPLKSPKTGEIVRKVDPKKLFNLIAYNAWATADPGVLFFDRINERNVMKSYRGEVRVTNPCGEEPLYPYESCNLASVNIGNFLVKGAGGQYEIDWERFHKVTKTVARLLDNIISINKYPLEDIDRETKKTRRIGVGLMGVANALFRLGIKYNSEDGFRMMGKIAEHLTYYSYEGSVEAAAARGPFPVYELTSYSKGEMPIEGYYRKDEWTLDWSALVDAIKRNGLRNAMVTTAPPTGSIGMIADASTGIEPVFSLAFEKRVSVGSFYYTNEIFEEELKKSGMYSPDLIKEVVKNYGSAQGIDDKSMPREIKDVFVTAIDIHWADHIMAQAALQKWITDSISKTINMPSDTTVEDIEQAYIIAHELGCKGITIYRDESKNKQVLNINSDVKERRFETGMSTHTRSAIESLMAEKEYLQEYFTGLVNSGAREKAGSAAAVGVAVASARAAASSAGNGESAVSSVQVTSSGRSIMEAHMIAPTIRGGAAAIANRQKERMEGGVKAGMPSDCGNGSHKQGLCPSCEGMNVANEGGCVSCKDCGWSACSIS